MKLSEIDWNAMWVEDAAISPWSTQARKELWEKHADDFTKRVVRVKTGAATDRDEYADRVLQRIETSPEYTVLDIGCGPGTLTLPLSKKVSSVTALDISEGMIRNLKASAAAEGINNIKYVNSAWEDALADNLVDMHDIVVASRSLTLSDLKQTFSALAAVARHAVYVTVPIVHLPLDWEAYKAIGRDRVKHPSYIYIMNMLYQMGIQANLEIIYSRVRVHFPTVEETIDDLQWRTAPFTSEERLKLFAFLNKKVNPRDGSLTHDGKSKWALIWWDVQDNNLFKS
jgi:predicted TPR repeat methyltransferase